eukprot:c21010_g1_i1.p1 GENE.c21010_g1_i1~~c21010_g1_i1.p1  ORF type:complete len:552 (+),score=109.82 c21010_g1_i1:52-1707(+)
MDPGQYTAFPTPTHPSTPGHARFPPQPYTPVPFQGMRPGVSPSLSGFAPSSKPGPSPAVKRPARPVASEPPSWIQNKRTRTKRRVTEPHIPRTMPLRESEIYTRLVALEREIDLAISRRRKSILSAIQKPQASHTRRRTLRLWIYNMHHSQPLRDPKQRASIAKGKKGLQRLEEEAEAIDEPTSGISPECFTDLPEPPKDGFGESQRDYRQTADEADKPGWTLRVQGRVLPETDPMFARVSPPLRFSNCIERAVIELDNNFYTENNVVEWKAARHQPKQSTSETKPGATLDGFELKRVGCAECEIKIYLYPKTNSSHFRVLKPLSALLGIERATRPQILTMLWTYLHTNDLFDFRTGLIELANSELKKVFKEERMDMATLSSRVSQYLAPMNPLEFTHQLVLNGSAEASAMCYDVSLEVEDDSIQNMPSALPTLNVQKISWWNNELEKMKKRLTAHKEKQDLLLAFSHAPVDVLSSLICAQGRNIAMQNGEQRGNEDKLYHQTYYQPWIHEAILKYLNEQLEKESAKRDAEQAAKQDLSQSHLVNRLQARK